MDAPGRGGVMDAATLSAEAHASLFDIRAIMGMLQHRWPFLLVDKVIAYEKGTSLTAIKNVTYNEPFFAGHFPLLPTMPGVLILESMAQACGLLASQELGLRSDAGVLYYFAGIDDARFKRIVVPGDVLTLEVVIDKVKRSLWKFKARASVDGELACEAGLTCGIKNVGKPVAAPAREDA
ncbi:MAG: 3-hydroxyacyl-ACP dehydratase FabZ [Nevskia sp.]|nr:3-hydroxyacyl-ACP dehydratase FabZ [Nevskia sp.]